jgi:hypothetical protein
MMALVVMNDFVSKLYKTTHLVDALCIKALRMDGYSDIQYIYYMMLCDDIYHKYCPWYCILLTA